MPLARQGVWKVFDDGPEGLARPPSRADASEPQLGVRSWLSPRLFALERRASVVPGRAGLLRGAAGDVDLLLGGEPGLNGVDRPVGFVLVGQLKHILRL